MTPTEYIDKAAKEYSHEKLVSTTGKSKWAKVATAQVDFTAGAEWALQQPELMREVAVNFRNWCDENEEIVDYQHGKPHTPDELFTLYLSGRGDQEKNLLK